MFNKNILRSAAVGSILLFMFTIICSIGVLDQDDTMSENNRYAQGGMITTTPIPKFNTLMLEYDDDNRTADKFDYNNDTLSELVLLPKSVWDTVAGVKDSPVLDKLPENVVIISKSEYLIGDEEVELIDLAVDRQLQFIIKGIKINDFKFTNIYRIIGEELYDEPVLAPTPTPVPTPTPAPATAADATEDSSPMDSGTTEDNPDNVNGGKGDTADAHHQSDDHLVEIVISNDPIQSNIVKYTDEEDGTYTASITFNLNKTYVYELMEDEAYYYICLLRPKDVYSKIVVIDAGHGGMDGGTYSKDHKYNEKDVNLSILIYLKELLDEDEGIKTYYTRTTDRRLTLNQRVNLANDLEADLFISIHCNSNPAAQVNGLEVLYNDKQNDWEGMNSKRFAAICLEEATSGVGLTKRGIVPRSQNVHIISAANMPVVLIETAFMTNTKDLEILIKASAQKSLAGGLYKAIKRAYEEMEN